MPRLTVAELAPDAVWVFDSPAIQDNLPAGLAKVTFRPIGGAAPADGRLAAAGIDRQAPDDLLRCGQDGGMTKTSADAPPARGAPPVLTDAETLLRAGSFHARLERARAQRAEALARLGTGEAPRTARPGSGDAARRPGGPGADGFILNPSRPFASADGDGLPVSKLYAHEAGFLRPSAAPEPAKPDAVAPLAAALAANRGAAAAPVVRPRAPQARPAFIGHAEEDARLAAERAAGVADPDQPRSPVTGRPQLSLVPAAEILLPDDAVSEAVATSLPVPVSRAAAALLPVSGTSLATLDQTAALALSRSMVPGSAKGRSRGWMAAAAVAALAVAGGAWFAQQPNLPNAPAVPPLAVAPEAGPAPVLAATAPAPVGPAPAADAPGTLVSPADPRPIADAPVTLSAVASPGAGDLAFAAPVTAGLAPVAAPMAPASITAPPSGFSEPHLLSASIPPSISAVPPARAGTAPTVSDLPPSAPPELTVRLLAPKGTAKSARQKAIDLLAAAGVSVSATEPADATQTGPELRYFHAADLAAAKILAAQLGLPPGAVQLVTASAAQKPGSFDLLVARPAPAVQPAAAKPAQTKKRANKASDAAAMDALKTKILQQLQGTN